MTKRRTSSRAGMSLIEILVAVTLLGLLSVGLVTALQVAAGAWSDRTGPVGPLLPAELRGLLEQFAFAGSTTGAVPAPPCREQAPLGRVVGQVGRYPNLQPIPAP